MKKKVMIASILLCFIVGLGIAYIFPYEKEINSTLDGLQLDFYNEETQSPVKVSIRGTAEYRYFTLREFDGQIKFSDTRIPWNEKSVHIQFQRGLGHARTYNEENQLNSLQSVGYVFTDDFDEIVILLHGEEGITKIREYIVAPARNRQQSAELAGKLSKNTSFSEIEWGN